MITQNSLTNVPATIGKVDTPENAIIVKEVEDQPKVGENDTDLSTISGTDQGYQSEGEVVARSDFGDVATVSGLEAQQVGAEKLGVYNQWGQVAAHSQRQGESPVKKYQVVTI